MARTRNRFNAIDKMQNADKTSESAYAVALYARLSVETSDRPSESIENQLEIMRRFIADKPEFASYREFIDRAYTGTNFDRPAFQKMMEEARIGRINCIIVKDMSRLGREFLETCNLIEIIFPFLQIRFISINDHFDTGKEACGNKSMEIAVKNMVNDMYARDTSKRVSTVRTQEIEKGRFTGAYAPYGYKVDNDHPLRRFVIDQPAAAVVRDMFNMVLQGKTLRDISLEFQERDLSIPGKYAKSGCLYRKADENDYWRVGTISSMLKNEAYIGNMVQGRCKKRLCDGENDHKMDRDEWIVVENTHEPIVSREVFDRVGEVLKQRHNESTFAVNRTDEVAIVPNKYAGILYCGMCGAPMEYRSEINGTKRKYYFACGNTYRMGKDKCKTHITETELDKVVTAAISSAYKKTVKTVKDSDIRTILNNKLSRKEQEYLRKKKRLKARIESIDARLAEEYERYVTGEITGSDFAVISQSYDTESEKYEEEICRLEAGFSELKVSVKKRVRWSTFLADGNRKENLSPELLVILVKRIDVFAGHRIHIIYAFEEQGRSM